jgi:hypothetical protein
VRARPDKATDQGHVTNNQTEIVHKGYSVESSIDSAFDSIIG